MRTITDMVFDYDEAPQGALAKSTSYGDQIGVPKSWFTDPFALLDSLGLGYKSSPSGLSYETLRQMAEHNVIISSIIQTRVHQVASFTRLQPNKYSVGFRIAHRDKQHRLSKSEIEHVRDIEQFMLHTGEDHNQDRDDLEACTKKLVRDRLIYDQTCTEQVNKYNGQPHAFYAVPGSTIRLAAPKKRKGTPLKPDEVGRTAKYVQIIDGVIVNTYSAEEMGWSVANPRTDIRAWGYGYSELEMLIKTITAHLWAEEWNRKAFSQGTTAKGILNLKGNIPPQQLDAFKRQWLTQISGVANAWRTPVINSNEDIQWISLQPTNNEMGYQEWMQYLIKVACAVYLIDPAEINFDIRAGQGQQPMFMGTNEAQQKVSQDRGLRPLLRHIQNHYNKNVVWRIDPHYEFEYVGIDAKTEEQAIELRLKELQSYKTLNEVRQAEQLPPVVHGDVVPNPTYIGYRNQKELAQLQGGATGGMPGGQPPPPDAGQGGNPGFGGADEATDEQHPAVKQARKDIEGELGSEVASVPRSPRRKADRYRPNPPLEDWETTYNASVKDADLRKALEAFDDLEK